MAHRETRSGRSRAERRLRLVSAIARGRRWLDEIISGSVTGAEQIAVRDRPRGKLQIVYPSELLPNRREERDFRHRRQSRRKCFGDSLSRQRQRICLRKPREMAAKGALLHTSFYIQVSKDWRMQSGETGLRCKNREFFKFSGQNRPCHAYGGRPVEFRLQSQSVRQELRRFPVIPQNR
jgi:hypothetical protein